MPGIDIVHHLLATYAGSATAGIPRRDSPGLEDVSRDRQRMRPEAVFSPEFDIETKKCCAIATESTPFPLFFGLSGETFNEELIIRRVRQLRET